jgi:uncharacterized membrane protein
MEESSPLFLKMPVKLKNLVYEGFGVGLGMLAAFAVYIVIGLAFFIPGYLMFMKEQKKQQKNTAVQGIALVLMLLGVAIMGGLGLGALLGDASEFFE